MTHTEQLNTLEILVFFIFTRFTSRLSRLYSDYISDLVVNEYLDRLQNIDFETTEHGLHLFISTFVEMEYTVNSKLPKLCRIQLDYSDIAEIIFIYCPQFKNADMDYVIESIDQYRVAMPPVYSVTTASSPTVY